MADTNEYDRLLSAFEVSSNRNIAFHEQDGRKTLIYGNLDRADSGDYKLLSEHFDRFDRLPSIWVEDQPIPIMSKEGPLVGKLSGKIMNDKDKMAKLTTSLMLFMQCGF